MRQQTIPPEGGPNIGFPSRSGSGISRHRNRLSGAAIPVAGMLSLAGGGMQSYANGTIDALFTSMFLLVAGYLVVRLIFPRGRAEHRAYLLTYSIGVFSGGLSQIYSLQVFGETQSFVDAIGMDLWVRIGLEHALVASSKITSTYYQTSPTDKPRFHRYPRHILSCVTLLGVLDGRQALTPERRHALERYIRAWNTIYFWRFVRVNARDTLKEILANSGARRFAPACYWALSLPLFWPSVRCAGLIRSPFVSRKFLAWTGGVRKKDGVVLKLE